MPTINRKRRAPTAPDEASSSSSSSSSSTPPRRQQQSTQQQSTQSPPRRPSSQASTPSAAPTRPSSASPPPTSPTTTQTHALVRFALSTGPSRLPLRRTDINAKCGTTAATFRRVFDDAQFALGSVWGMQLVELPGREKFGLRERQAAAERGRAAAASASAGTQSAGAAGPAGKSAGASEKSWILTSALPEAMRHVLARADAGVAGSDAPAAAEASYMGFTTFVVALVALSGGVLAEPKLERHLRRVNADKSTPVDSTERVLGRMVREGYLVRTREGQAGDEVVEFRVGPRGKVEIGEGGVGGLVRGVFGAGEMGEEEAGELKERIERSLRVGAGRGGFADGEVNGVERSNGMPTPAAGISRGRGRPKRARDDGDD